MRALLLLLVGIFSQTIDAFIVTPKSYRNSRRLFSSASDDGEQKVLTNQGPPPGFGPPPGVGGGHPPGVGGGPPPGVGGGPPPGVGGGPPPGVGGGPPPGVGVGGPPPGVAGGGPPGGPPRGGPPPQTASQKILENVFEVAFSLLYLGDDSGIRDSSKNLRVLWTRALLSNLGKIDDPVANDLLPSKTKWVVGKGMARNIWDGSDAVSKLDWIVNRTKFIDSQFEQFLSETADAESRQVIVLGSGYDTRALRYRSPGIAFFELDLPDISAMKSRMVQQYLDSEEEGSTALGPRPVHIPFDLNEVLTRNKSVLDALKAAGLKTEGDNIPPTMVICEAVLFYLIPGAVQKLVDELFQFEGATRFCITDNLSKVGVTPGPPVPTPRQKCESWLQQNGKELVDHDAIWGGAIHFVGAK